MKKFALVSPCAAFMRLAAEELHATYGVQCIDFNSVIEEFIALKKITRSDEYVRSLLLPALEFLLEKYADVSVVLFDMDTLIHEVVMAEVKKSFTVCAVAEDEKTLIHYAETILEKTMLHEYSEHLSFHANKTFWGSDTKTVKELHKYITDNSK